MDEATKQLLKDNSLARITKLFSNTDDATTRFAKSIADMSVQSAIIVLEEYEKLKDVQ